MEGRELEEAAMCGIVGIAGRQDTSWVSVMNGLLAHRGPDDSGEFHDPETGVALAMQRLSILDTAGGRQPMGTGDGSLWIVHNGEIYNAPEIRPRLLAQGYEFRTSHSDTEVLLHLYHQKREEMLHELNGMFAFVIYDKVRRRLFGARDRAGIKPLYYVAQAGRFAFASELKALLLLPGLGREIDPASLFHYMSLLYVPGEASIFREVRRIPPAHSFTYDLDTRALTIRPYWDLDVRHTEQRSEEEWAALLRTELRAAVRRWMLSDVPVGCSLSGGLDSSTIVGLLGEMGGKVKTYSLGFAGPGEQAWNELPLARQVAERWGTEHHELVLEPEDLLRDLVRMVWHLDEPYGGGLPSWYVFQFMRKDVTVGLTGTGGDEVFGNYGKFMTFEGSLLGRLGIDRRRVPRLDRYVNTWYYLADATKRRAVLQDAVAGDAPPTAALLNGLARACGAGHIRDAIAYVDFKTQLVDEFLSMTDRFSMAHSLEARVPFLDHAFVELVFRVPAALRTRGDDPKYLLKKAVGDLLPPALLRAKKRGFVIPITLWLRNQLRPLVESLLAPERLSRQGIFRREFYPRFVLPHLDGRADHTWQVWAAVMFQLWHLVFIEEKAVSAPSFSWRDICSGSGILAAARPGLRRMD
jgi:asparagine synthase (glutamine-hydrolysing)